MPGHRGQGRTGWPPCCVLLGSSRQSSLPKEKRLSICSGVGMCSCDSGMGPGQQTPPPPCWPGWGSRACSLTIRGFVSKNNTTLLGDWVLGALSDHQNIKNGLNITQPCRPSGPGADPAHPALLGPVSTPCLPSACPWPAPARCPNAPECQGWDTPARPRGSWFFKAVKFCILAQASSQGHRAAKTPCGWPSSGVHLPESGDPSLQLGTKCKHGSSCVC